MINDNIKIKGALHLYLYDSITGAVKLDQWYDNLVVTTGKELLASRLSSASDSVITHIAIGTDNTSENTSDTTLGTEVARVATTVSGGTPAGNTVSYTTTFNAGVGTGALEEAGLFNDVSAGTMLSRVTYPVINKGASDVLVINWTITVG